MSGALLRPFGYTFRAVRHDSDSFLLEGPHEKILAFSDLAAPVCSGTVLGLAAIVLSAKDGKVYKVAGVNAAEAERFISSSNEVFSAYVQRQFAANEEELLTLSEALDRLERPRRFPAACLIEPFLARATKALQGLPNEMPDGALTERQQQVLNTVRTFQRHPKRIRDKAIDIFVENELAEMAAFFDGIESNPLTAEQRLAVVTDDDATLVLAGAGSGKTSVIVAKAAYLIARGIRPQNEILLLAFGNDAAREMAERIEARAGAEVDAMTFHALGNKIIRDVGGRAPPLAAHASDQARYRGLLRDILINEVAGKLGLGSDLLDWFSEFYWPYKNEWDFKSQKQYYEWVEAHELRTLNGDRVKSFEEWEIANWLYRNGIEFEYEPLYDHPLPSDARGSYHPDFRLKESGIYIEHFGVRKERSADGSTRLTTAPYINRDKYLADMEWKRKVHASNETTLIETFSYEKVEGRLLQNLKEKLAPHVELKPLPDEDMFATLAELGQVDAFTQTIGTFLRHFKSGGADMARCRSRAGDDDGSSRSHAFLKIFEPLFDAYEKRLGDEIDFEDMINRATEHIETGRYQSLYRHILVDEFQDISESRARLLRALKRQHADARLFAVGDDWQSIFRFAGSDIRLMRDFGQEFGGQLGDQAAMHSVVDLGRTFRSVDKIALPARAFVLQNPSQLEKKVITATSTDTPAIKVAYYDHGQDLVALHGALKEIAATGRGKASILLLGRYNRLRPKNLSALESDFPMLSLRFMTAHGSKGLEADHVIILRAAAAVMGFPSEIVDDPLLDLVLPTSEPFEHAEERRLFYVALTRARATVTILADRTKPSVFVRELVEHPQYETVEITDRGVAERHCARCGGRMLSKTDKSGRLYFACEHSLLCGEKLRPCAACGQALPTPDPQNDGKMKCRCGAEFEACPVCEEGWLVERSGPYGSFFGCVRYPECRGKKQPLGR